MKPKLAWQETLAFLRKDMPPAPARPPLPPVDDDADVEWAITDKGRLTLRHGLEET